MNEIIIVENKNKTKNEIKTTNIRYDERRPLHQCMTNCNGILWSKSINEFYQMEWNANRSYRMWWRLLWLH